MLPSEETGSKVCMLLAVQIEGEFPELLPIKESLIKYVFEPNAAKVRRDAETRDSLCPQAMLSFAGSTAFVCFGGDGRLLRAAGTRRLV